MKSGNPAATDGHLNTLTVWCVGRNQMMRFRELSVSNRGWGKECIEFARAGNESFGA